MSFLQDTPLNAGVEAEARRVAPLTYHQERLWFIDEFERGRVYADAPTYHNMPVLLRIDGTIDVPAVEQALHRLVARHEALRTSIDDGRQHVHAAVTLPLAIVDLESTSDAASVDAAIERALEDCRRPFRLTRAPLFRAALYRLSPARHLLAWTVHHAVADLRSTGILIEDFVDLYRAAFRGDGPALPSVAGFSAYAAWQRALPDSAFDAALTFWRWQLRGALAPLELPYREPRPHIHVYASAFRRVDFEPSAATAIHALAARAEGTSGDVILSAFLGVLSAWSRQREIVVGTSHANRDSSVERMAGPIANLLVLRCDVDPAKPFDVLLRQVSRVRRHAMANRALPFDRLVQRLNPPKDMSRTALFDVLYRYLEPEPDEWILPDATATRIDCFAGAGKYDLNLTVRPRGAGLTGILEFNRTLFHDELIDDLLALFGAMWTRVAARPGAPLAQHLALPPALADRQRRMLRAEAGESAPHQTVDAAFEAVVSRMPDRIAIASGDGQITYRALAESAHRISRALLAADVRCGTLVGVLLDRSADAVASMLAILRLGAAYVPIDPAYPPRRIAMLLDDAECPVVVTRAALSALVQEPCAGRAIRVVPIEECRAFAATPVRARAAAGDVAYSIYTSGSTGRPKGCLVTHGNVVQLVLSQAAAFRFSREEVWTWSHSFCFDFSVWEIFGTLLYGARGVLLSDEEVRTPAIVERRLLQEQVTVLNQTPAAGYRLVQQLLDTGASARGLRCVIFGGDMLTPKLLEPWTRQHPGVAIVNMFGITETTVHVTYKRLTPEEVSRDSRSIGRALPNAAAYVLDARLDLQPPGALGEIGVTGSGVSLGYWRRPDLTADRFVPDPFSDRPGARLYRSGDLGRVLPDGEIAFHGRRDNQVKIRGYRVELGEVEAAVAEYAEGADIAVVAREDACGHRMLVAFVSPGATDGRATDIDALRLRLQEQLIPGLMPAVIQIVDVLPRTSTGKIDRKALAALALTPAASRRGHVPPRDDRERILARIWEEVLGRSPIGITDNFFEIGGDSILSMQICARARRAGIPLTTKQVFEHDTIEALSAAVARDADPETTADSAGGLAPLLPAQAWFFAQRQPEPNHFNQSAWFTLAPDVGAADIEAALRQLQAHHEALRLVFVEQDGEIWQTVHDAPSELPLTIVTPSGDSAAERETAAAAAAECAQRELDIAHGPLFRVVYVEKTADDPHGRLLLVLHHLIVDHVSWRTLIDDLDLLLQPRPSGASLPLLPPTASLLRYTSALAAGHERAAGRADTRPDDGRDPHDELATQEPAIAFPSDIAASDGDEDNAYAHDEQIETVLDVPAAAAIDEALAEETLAWEDVLLAGAGQALREWTGGDVVTVHVEGHGRPHAAHAQDLSRTLGWFMKLYRVRIGAAASPWESVAAARRALMRAKAGPDVLERAQRPGAHADAGSASRIPGFCLNYVGRLDALSTGMQRVTLRQDATGSAIAPRNRRPHLLELHARMTRGRMHLRWGYSTRIHTRATVERLASACMAFLHALPRGLAHARTRAGHASGEGVPLAPGQLGILYHTLLQPADAPEYIVRFLWRVEGAFDIAAFRASWAFLLQRHEALRAFFTWDGPDGPLQRFADRADPPVAVQDWRGLDPGAIAVRLDALARGSAGHTINLATPPLLSIDVVRTAEDEHHVLVQMHHLIVDGWSLAILRQELMRAYSALRRGRAVRLPRAGQLRDYLRHLARQDEDAARAFWQQRLRSVRGCLLRTGADSGASASIVESEHLEILARSIAPTRGLGRWAARHRLTLNTIVQGLWCLTVGSLTRSITPVVGVVVAGRPFDMPDVERTVGTFINTLPLCARLDAQVSLATWLRTLQADSADAQPFDCWPLPRICAWAGVGTDQPLFDTVVVCQNYPRRSLPRLHHLRIHEVRYSLKESVPVVLEYSVSPRLICRFRYRPDLVSAAVVRHAAELLRAGVAAIEREPDVTVPQMVSRLADAAAASGRAREAEFTAVRRQALRELAGRTRARRHHES